MTYLTQIRVLKLEQFKEDYHEPCARMTRKIVKRSTFFLCVYRPPALVVNYSGWLSLLRQLPANVLTGGDFNLDHILQRYGTIRSDSVDFANVMFLILFSSHLTCTFVSANVSLTSQWLLLEIPLSSQFDDCNRFPYTTLSGNFNPLFDLDQYQNNFALHFNVFRIL